jgi:hypothetical protein
LFLIVCPESPWLEYIVLAHRLSYCLKSAGRAAVAVFISYAVSRCVQVFAPTLPSAARPAAAWILRTAASVTGPNSPAAETGIPAMSCTAFTSPPALFL